MKNLILIILIISTLGGCISIEDDISNKGFDYTVVDTVYVSKNVFNAILNYRVIVKIDSVYYSASMSKYGIIRSLDRKLKIKLWMN